MSKLRPWSLVRARHRRSRGRRRTGGTGDTLGKTTVEQRIVPAAGPGFNTLTTGPGEDYIVRDGDRPPHRAGRAATTRRTSLGYFGQLTDFQLADEESPARVEFLDPLGSTARRRLAPVGGAQPARSTTR